MKHTKLISITIITWLLILIFCSSPTSAQSANLGNAQGIRISPTLYELNAEKGKTYELKFNVMNVTQGDLVYSTSVDDFGSSDETGSPRIIADDELPISSSIKSWMPTVPGFFLKSLESKDIVVRVTIPDNAEPGGHYGVLRFSGSAPELDSNGVGLSASAGTLILIRVDGEISETASLASFFISKDKKQSSFFENGPLDFSIRIKNDGNVHIKPSGDIQIIDMFGGIVDILSINNKEPRANVLPDSVRRFDVKLKNEWMFGRFMANLSLGYGTKGQAITRTITFWVIPWKIILIVLLVLATIIFVLKRLIKVYNRHIIQKSKNEEKNNKDKNSN